EGIPAAADIVNLRYKSCSEMAGQDQVKSLEIDLFIFSCEGIDNDGVLWDSSANNAAYKSLLLKRAAQSLLLIDKSKFDRSGEVRIGNLRDVTQIISDAGPDNLFLPSVAGSGR
ncbi:hypothetical protein RYZ49_30650, partial [Klebsiella pasteurii]|nr:hypothetical protein [Klebsiella pasteurii]